MENAGGTAGVEITGVKNAEGELQGLQMEEDLLWKAKYGVRA